MNTETAPSEEIKTNPLILVVDDSRAQRKIVALNLKKWGFEVIEAGSGLEAINICKERDIDLILSDWVMPEMDGLEFCRAFRRMDRDRYGYFILLTSKNEREDVAMGLDVGADDFLSKPVNTAELEARIRAGVRVLDMEDQLIARNETLNNTLQELQHLYDEIDKDLVEASKLQKSLIPRRQCSFGAHDVSLLFQSSGHVGGDLVGFFSFSEDRLGLYSIDVSGHGISSALLTARLAGFLSPHSQDQNVAFEKKADGTYRLRNPGEVASLLNANMLEEMETEHYFTLAYADIQLPTGLVRMVQAGHPHPAVFNPETGVRYVGTGGPPIGLIPDIPFDDFELSLKPGDRLFLHSDGITECQSPDGTLLDEDGLADLLQTLITGSGQEFLADIIWHLTEFAQDRGFDDDVSAILFEFNENSH